MIYELFRQDAFRWTIYQSDNSFSDASQLSFRVVLGLLFHHMALRSVAWFRFGSWCKQKKIPFLPGYIQRRIYRHYGLEIVIGANIGGGLYIAHPVGTVISPKRIGKNCSIVSAVTIGMRNSWEFPTIDDDVYIGAGARILGGIHIGEHVSIGANAVVIQDIPAFTTAVGIPAKPLQKNV